MPSQSVVLITKLLLMINAMVKSAQLHNKHHAQSEVSFSCTKILGARTA
jgi:hypothetical protein